MAVTWQNKVAGGRSVSSIVTEVIKEFDLT